MKKVLVLASLLLVAVMVLGCLGCGGSNTNVTPSFLKYGTLQGKIMDATTGAAIGGDDLEIKEINWKDFLCKQIHTWCNFLHRRFTENGGTGSQPAIKKDYI